MENDKRSSQAERVRSRAPLTTSEKAARREGGLCSAGVGKVHLPSTTRYDGEGGFCRAKHRGTGGASIVKEKRRLRRRFQRDRYPGAFDRAVPTV